MYLMIKWINLD